MIGGKWISVLIGCICFASCQKQDGYIYKACYTTPHGWVNANQTTRSVATNFFTVDIQDSAYAMQWYMKTDAYHNAMVTAGADSLWIEYWGTLEEWQDEPITIDRAIEKLYVKQNNIPF